jgi:hypothetical protein
MPVRESSPSERCRRSRRADEFRGFLDRVLRPFRRDRQCTNRTKDRIKQRPFVDVLKDDETDRTRTGELQHERIDPGEMIRQEQKATCWQALLEVRRDTIDQSRKCGAEKTEQALGEFRFRCSGHGCTLPGNCARGNSKGARICFGFRTSAAINPACPPITRRTSTHCPVRVVRWRCC